VGNNTENQGRGGNTRRGLKKITLVLWGLSGWLILNRENRDSFTRINIYYNKMQKSASLGDEKDLLG